MNIRSKRTRRKWWRGRRRLWRCWWKYKTRTTHWCIQVCNKNICKHIIKTILKVCFTLKTHNQSGSMLLHKLFLLHFGLWHYAAVVVVVVFQHKETLLEKKNAMTLLKVFTESHKVIINLFEQHISVTSWANQSSMA